MNCYWISLCLIIVAARCTTVKAACTCANQSWCLPLQTPMPLTELFAYTPNEEMWSTSYDWTKITTVITYQVSDTNMICYAHSRGVRVVLAFGGNWATASTPAAREALATQVAGTVETFGLDGINMDFEEVNPDPLYTNYVTALFYRVTDLVRAKNPIAQTSLCIASFYENGGTWYTFDFAGILAKSDFLMAMMYDMSSSRVGANSFAPSINWTLSGLYQLASMAPGKLVLGFPWYGYEYSCKNGTVLRNTCEVAKSGEVNYDAINAILLNQNSRYRNPSAVDVDTNPANGTFAIFSVTDLFDADYPTHMFVFDNPATLTVKYTLAMKGGARGLSMWTASSLGNSTTEPFPSLRKSMWEAINGFF